MTGAVRRRDVLALAAAAVAARAVPAWPQDGGGRRAPGDPPAGSPDGKPEQKPADETPTKPKSAVDLALDWLARHQSADGRWFPGAFTDRCADPACGGAGTESGTVRTTACALLAFLTAGETHQSGAHKKTVVEALKAIRNLQMEDGCFGPRSVAGWMSGHLAAADAMCQAYGLTQSEIFRDVATRGVRFALAALSPAGGFRSDVHPDAADPETICRLLLLLRSASQAELVQAPAATAAIWGWFNGRLDEKKLVVAPTDSGDTDPQRAEDRLVCAGLVRVWGASTIEDLRADKVVQRIADRIVAKPPKWPPAGPASFRALQLRSEFLFQTHGEKHLAWNRALLTLAVEKQRVDGCARGSWDPVDGDGAQSGRVGATAVLSVACGWPYAWGWRLAPPKADAPAKPPKDEKSK